MEVVELRNVNALGIPKLQDLIRRAIESEVLLTEYPFDTLAQDIFDFVSNPREFMLLGAEKGEFKALALGYEPSSKILPYPTVILIYNEGSLGLLKLMKQKLLDMALAKGYTKVLAVNGSKRPDGPWLRLLTPKGMKGTIIGSLVQFEVE